MIKAAKASIATTSICSQARGVRSSTARREWRAVSAGWGGSTTVMMTTRHDLNLGGKRTKPPVQIRPLKRDKKQYKVNRNSGIQIEDHSWHILSPRNVRNPSKSCHRLLRCRCASAVATSAIDHTKHRWILLSMQKEISNSGMRNQIKHSLSHDVIWSKHSFIFLHSICTKLLNIIWHTEILFPVYVAWSCSAGDRRADASQTRAQNSLSISQNKMPSPNCWRFKCT